MPLVSVALCVANSWEYLDRCLNSILNQTFSDFELIIVSDSDNYHLCKIVKRFADPRIMFFLNDHWLGLAKSRNKSVSIASGEYIFFTDSDCIVSRDWIEKGLKSFASNRCVGVEGTVYYVSTDYEPTFSDHIMENRNGDNFITANMAYKAKILIDLGGFDERYTYNEDRDVAFKIKKKGEILFNPEMIVYHQRVTFSPKKYLKSAGFSKNRVYLYKKYHDKSCLYWRFFNPANLLKVIFPPAVFFSFFLKKFRSREDYLLLPFSYPFAIKERILFWRECIRERVFLI
jgi:glycosyltransferase involved in cell wall biosynthesis